MRAASTSGTRAPRSPWRWRAASTPSRLDGEPLRYGDPDAWLPDLVVCRHEHAATVLDVTTRERRPYW